MANDRKHLFDDPKNIRRLLSYFYVICALLFVLDFIIHRHIIHRWENLIAFYPLFGFVGCVVLVLVARWMRTWLMRAEDYYENEINNLEPKDKTKKLDKKIVAGVVSKKKDAGDVDTRKGGQHVDD